MKKKIVIIIIVLITTAILFLIIKNPDTENVFIDTKFNQIKNKDQQLKKVCKNNNLFNYIRKNSKDSLSNITDNQGGGNVLYYVASLNKREIGIYGIREKNNNIRITRITDYSKDQSK
ncbi:hypothetical protein LNP07_04680 [Apilactobacillus sp. M161]|uniref:Uncharacterized protein n=1 Tax=Apilactobacillus xinyiensis TaxID=2841032 RepID=A0ABT0I261_9LACO|nr:hypothetical protein [Apilactobacillus xinyiensis]MCK8624807.1 hypothetical protein [Apilactobacillus xinyiensis]